jgi:hypothetical protein
VFIGHFAVAFGAKRAAPRASLGTLFLAVQFADFLWPIFLLLGLEKVRIAPGDTRFTPLDFVSYPYSHSLLADLLWGALLGFVCFALRRGPREALVVALCVPSHWVLDFIVHRPDLPIFPGGPRYGLGLWNSIPGTLAVEISLYVIGIAIYLRTTRAKDRPGVYILWSLLLFLFASYLSAAFGPPPPNLTSLAIAAPLFWLTVPWAAWADRHRTAV